MTINTAQILQNMAASPGLSPGYNNYNSYGGGHGHGHGGHGGHGHSHDDHSGEAGRKMSHRVSSVAYLLGEVNQRIKRAKKSDLAVISFALLQSKYFQGMGIVTTIRRLRL